MAKHFYFEQKGLCIYCQQNLKIAFDNNFETNISHIEHIKPKARNKYPEDTFNQKNLTLSCNGFDCRNEIDKSEFCGHNKQAKYNADLFVNPIELQDIEKYFEYTFTGDINPADNLNKQEREKAEEMIKILDLKNPRLVNMRLENFNNIINMELSNIELLLDENVDLLPSFFSMIKQLLK